MNRRFRQVVESLHPAFERLVRASPHKKGATLPPKGVYLFREKGKAIYVGRSNDVPRRYADHVRPNSPSSFAVLIARKELGLRVDYRKGARADRWANPKFQAAFSRAKRRIQAMEFRAVEECDQTRQVLLEVYCASVLKTPYNDFGTH